MLKSEVIKLLEAIEGDPAVWVVTDHGQQPEQVFQVVTSYIDIVIGEEIASEDIENGEYEPEDVNSIIMIN